MSKSKNKSKQTPQQLNTHLTIKNLYEALHRIEGEYSGIPYCCIDNFCYGETYSSLKNFLEQNMQNDLLKKLKKYNYVPCYECLEQGYIVNLKLNGTSDTGNMLLTIMQIIKERETQNAGRPRKKSVRKVS